MSDDERQPPTKAFRPLPTEVLEGPARTEVDPEAATRRRPFPADSPQPGETEVLSPSERPTGGYEAPTLDDVPSPFDVSDASDPVRQAIARAAQKPTAFDLRFEGAPVPRPVFGVEDPFATLPPDPRFSPTADDVPAPPPPSEDIDGWEPETLAFPDPGLAAGTLGGPTLDEIGDAFDEALQAPAPPPEPPSLLPMPPAAEVPLPPGASVEGLPPPDEPPPEPSPAPIEPPPARRRSALRVALLCLALVVLSAAAAGAYLRFVVEARGATKEALAEAEPSSAKAPAFEPSPPEAKEKAPPHPEEAVEVEALEPSGSQEKAEEAPAPAVPIAEKEAPPAPKIDPKWKDRDVWVGILRTRDRSKSRVPGLERALKMSFARGVGADEHAKWHVRSRRVKRGHLVYLDVLDVRTERVEGGLEATVRCRVTAYQKPGKNKKLVRTSKATASVAGPASKALRHRLVKDATGTCGTALSAEFVAGALE